MNLPAEDSQRLTLNSFYVRVEDLKIYTSGQLPPDVVGDISLFYSTF